jgi:hypothetical protein
MAILAMLKLQDVEKFSTMFVGYDLLARRWVPTPTPILSSRPAPAC